MLRCVVPGPSHSQCYTLYTVTLPAVPGEEVLHHFQMSREESQRLKDIDTRLLAIKEENERIEKAIVCVHVDSRT